MELAGAFLLVYLISMAGGFLAMGAIILLFTCLEKIGW